MNLDELWAALEHSAPEDRDGRMMRRIHPESPIDLWVSAQRRDPRRTLELRVSHATAAVDLPAGTRGIGLAPHTVAGQAGRTAITLELQDTAAAQLFASLCADIAAVTARCEDERRAVATLVNRFLRWRRLMERAPEGLSPARQRGLYAELWALRELLAPALGIDAAVGAWIGPEGAPRDFEHRGVGIETKSSAANEPQIVAINGERQLDEAGLASLHLVHLSLEIIQGGGETLPEMVRSLRTATAGQAAEATFEDLLLGSGYADDHAARYTRDGYTVRRLSVMRVADDFPRLTEDALPDGIGSVHYRLAIDACRDHEIDPSTLTSTLKHATDATN